MKGLYSTILVLLAQAQLAFAGAGGTGAGGTGAGGTGAGGTGAGGTGAGGTGASSGHDLVSMVKAQPVLFATLFVLLATIIYLKIQRRKEQI